MMVKEVVMNESSGKATGGGRGGGAESELGVHNWTGRDGRKKMKNMFSSLEALLPQLTPKADKSTIVDEAVKYIKSLEHTLQTFQRQKLNKLQSTISSITSNAALATDTREREAGNVIKFFDCRPFTCT